MKYKLFAFLFLIILSWMIAPDLSAQSKLDPLLSERISAGTDEFQRVVIMLGDRLDKFALDKNLALSSYTRQAAHALAVHALQEHSRTTQAGLLRLLREEQKDGDVRAFKGYWIDNMIWADLKTDLIAEIEAMPEVEMIYPEIDVGLIAPIDDGFSEYHTPGEITDNLKIIGADSAWKLGYTGEGTLACNFDTGVEGTHPGLVNNYRGTLGYPHQQCWFDPIANDTFPHIFSYISSRDHGTSTMGIILGKNDATGDTSGVAFGAEWIAAAVIDIPNTQQSGSFYLLDAFQWAADPDGDPNTIDDVPDVISNSWGYALEETYCFEVFYGAIDNLEALGAAVVFAAGNSGGSYPYYRTLNNPGDRAETPYNSFAVGMITDNYTTPVVDNMSSKGPSTCNPEMIKPNVIAPGKRIYTAVSLDTDPTGFKSAGSGTSFACPHVAGALLILRQYNRSAPVDSLKKALMMTATDIGISGPDSAAGYGLINIPAAMEYLGPTDEPHVYLQSLSASDYQQDDTVSFYVVLKNSGLGVLNLTGKIRSQSEDIAVLDSTADFGNIAMNATANNSAQQFRIYLSSGIPDGSEIKIDLVLTSSESYSVTVPVYFTFGDHTPKEIFTIDPGLVEFTISNFGSYGLATNSMYDFGGEGFSYENSPYSSLFEMGLLISTDEDHISNGVRNAISTVDRHFQPSLEDGSIEVVEPFGNAAQKTLCSFTDSLAVNPIGIRVRQATYAFDDDVNDHFMIMVYTLENISNVILEDINVSLFADWDMKNQIGILDLTGFDRESNTGYMCTYGGGDYRGITVLNEEGISGYRSIYYEDIYYGFTDALKWQYISEGFVDTASLDYSDYSNMITTGPFRIYPGEFDTAAFAIIAADSKDDLLDVYVPAARALFLDVEPQDTTDPVMTLEIFPNPVVPFELDIYAHSDEELRENPQLTVVSPSLTDNLTMTQLSGHDLITYSKDYQVTTAGTHTLTVCGTDTAYNEGCTQTVFSAGLAYAKTGAVVESPGGLFRLDIPGGALSGNGLVMMKESVPEDGAVFSKSDPLEFEPLYNLEITSQAGLVNGKTLLTADVSQADGYNSGDCCPALAKILDDGTLEIIAIQSDSRENVIEAEISEFGSFVLGHIDKSGGSSRIPEFFALNQNAPNPFNAETMISFSLPEASSVSLEIFNILGQKVNTLLYTELEAGNHKVFWNGKTDSGKNVSSGIYFYKLRTERFTDVKRMLLLK